MEADNRSNAFLQQLKKKMYLYMLPVLILAMTAGWLLDGLYDKHNFVNHTIFPLLDIWFVIALITIILKDKYLRIVEWVSLVFVSIIYISWLADLLFIHHQNTFTNGGLGEFTNWIPLFYLYISLIFDRKKALITSLIIFSFTLVMGIAAYLHIQSGLKVRASDTLLQFYLSTAVYIMALYFLQHLKEAFIQKEMLRQMANTDYLTGLPNRRLLEKNIEDLMKEKNQTFSVVLFDIDLFKDINDRFGHDTGDLVLREFTDLIKNNTRDTDTIGRWGGEEFLIIAKGQDLRQTSQLAERLRQMVETHSFFKVGSVTASFGVSEFISGLPKDDLIKQADLALYRAKEHGRNQVQVYEKEDASQ